MHRTSGGRLARSDTPRLELRMRGETLALDEAGPIATAGRVYWFSDTLACAAAVPNAGGTRGRGLVPAGHSPPTRGQRQRVYCRSTEDCSRTDLRARRRGPSRPSRGVIVQGRPRAAVYFTSSPSPTRRSVVRLFPIAMDLRRRIAPSPPRGAASIGRTWSYFDDPLDGHSRRGALALPP